MPSKDAQYDAKVAAAAKANASTIKQVGPQGGLAAGVIAGVKVPTFSTGPSGPTGPTGPSGPTWVKAATVQTANGPVDVDSNGLAEDGSRPVVINAGGGGGGGGGGNTTVPSSEMQDAYQRLFDEFSALGLGALVEDGKNLLMKATSISQMPEALRNTKAYMTRFSANDARIKSGLKALSPAAYIALEDQYQEVMRQYGLPKSYYTPGLYGKQEGFEKLIANDISNVELNDRLMVAQDRVLKSNPEVLQALKNFYPDISNGDILAYTLDPQNAIKDIHR